MPRQLGQGCTRQAGVKVRKGKPRITRDGTPRPVWGMLPSLRASWVLTLHSLPLPTVAVSGPHWQSQLCPRRWGHTWPQVGISEGANFYVQVIGIQSRVPVLIMEAPFRSQGPSCHFFPSTRVLDPNHVLGMLLLASEFP